MAARPKALGGNLAIVASSLETLSLLGGRGWGLLVGLRQECLWAHGVRGDELSPPQVLRWNPQVGLPDCKTQTAVKMPTPHSLPAASLPHSPGLPGVRMLFHPCHSGRGTNEREARSPQMPHWEGVWSQDKPGKGTEQHCAGNGTEEGKGGA